VIWTIRSESFGERKFQGAKWPGNVRARGPKGQGAKGPGSKSARVLLADSFREANWPGSEKDRYLADYIQTTWIESTSWPPTAWSAFKETVRTNSDLEGTCTCYRQPVCPSVRVSHACFVTGPKNLPAIFLYHRKGQSF